MLERLSRDTVVEVRAAAPASGAAVNPLNSELTASGDLLPKPDRGTADEQARAAEERQARQHRAWYRTEIARLQAQSAALQGKIDALEVARGAEVAAASTAFDARLEEERDVYESKISEVELRLSETCAQYESKIAAYEAEREQAVSEHVHSPPATRSEKLFKVAISCLIISQAILAAHNAQASPTDIGKAKNQIVPLRHPTAAPAPQSQAGVGCVVFRAID